MFPVETADDSGSQNHVTFLLNFLDELEPIPGARDLRKDFGVVQGGLKQTSVVRRDRAVISGLGDPLYKIPEGFYIEDVSGPGASTIMSICTSDG